MRSTSPPDLHLEHEAGLALGRRVGGVDEVGRGPLAGPVLAAAVILPRTGLPPALARLIKDSKQLSRSVRERLEPEIRAGVIAFAFGEASVQEIDAINILQATLLAMRRAVDALPVRPDYLLIDGRQLPRPLPCPAVGVIGGDRASQSIAAASIIAKVARDREMIRLDALFPGYGWAHNAGYGTAEHMAALRTLGATPHHRTSFAPVREQIRISA
ncbi:MAG: ribonuclease HII [Rhodospirillaceae bacterium]